MTPRNALLLTAGSLACLAVGLLAVLGWIAGVREATS